MNEPDPAVAVDLGDARLDMDRHRRIGMPEAVYAQGKTTEPGQVFSYCFLTVRENCESASTLQMGSLGRRTDFLTQNFKIYLGLDPTNSGSITGFWPPDDYDPELVP